MKRFSEWLKIKEESGGMTPSSQLSGNPQFQQAPQMNNDGSFNAVPTNIMDKVRATGPQMQKIMDRAKALMTGGHDATAAIMAAFGEYGAEERSLQDPSLRQGEAGGQPSKSTKTPAPKPPTPAQGSTNNDYYAPPSGQPWQQQLQ